MGVIADTLAATLRDLAASDARLYRGIDQYRTSTQQLLDAAQTLPAADLDSEIAAAIAFLAMDKSSFITGQCIVADGGFMALGM